MCYSIQYHLIVTDIYYCFSEVNVREIDKWQRFKVSLGDREDKLNKYNYLKLRSDLRKCLSHMSYNTP